jgi:GNAT superfamily N-acetyltransferase
VATTDAVLPTEAVRITDAVLPTDAVPSTDADHHPGAAKGEPGGKNPYFLFLKFDDNQGSEPTICRLRSAAGENMPDICTIRSFQPEDQAAAKALILEGLREHWGTIDPFKNPDLDDIASSYARGVFRIAEANGLVVGTGAMIPSKDDTAEIRRMSVARPYRRQGIGGAILAALIEDARSAGYRKLILETTSTWQDAVAFYGRHGFRMTHIKEGDTYFTLDLNSGRASVV